MSETDVTPATEETDIAPAEEVPPAAPAAPALPEWTEAGPKILGALSFFSNALGKIDQQVTALSNGIEDLRKRSAGGPAAPAPSPNAPEMVPQVIIALISQQSLFFKDLQAQTFALMEQFMDKMAATLPKKRSWFSKEVK